MRLPNRYVMPRTIKIAGPSPVISSTSTMGRRASRCPSPLEPHAAQFIAEGQAAQGDRLGLCAAGADHRQPDHERARQRIMVPHP